MLKNSNTAKGGEINQKHYQELKNKIKKLRIGFEL